MENHPKDTQHTHSQSIEHLAQRLETQASAGLGEEQAAERFTRLGPNELKEKPRAGFLRLLLAQFENFLILLLLAAAAISLVLGETVDAFAILAIITLNAVLGVVQEYRAERSLAALRKMAAPNAIVLRGGRQRVIPSRELVPGDVVLLEAGNRVPADLRLVESVNLKVDESALTGESVPVQKDARVILDQDIPVGDRANSAFMTSTVTYGRGRGIVTATGMHTQIGLIAGMLQSYEDEPTRLQRRLDELGRTLGVVSLAVCGIIFVYGILRDTQPMTIFTQGLAAYFRAEQVKVVDLFMTAVSLAIAAVPEGLPAVVTICLALGMQRMVSRNALVRKLPAVETLGCATVICSDKTGTLTQNEMSVVAGWTWAGSFSVTGEDCGAKGCYSREGRQFEPSDDPDLFMLLRTAVLCNDARLEQSGEAGGQPTWRMVGDPTEGALLVAAAKAGLRQESLLAASPRIDEVPFDSDRKRMTTIHPIAGSDPFAGGADRAAYVKGAPDIVLELCDRILANGKIRPVEEADRRKVQALEREMAGEAMRLLGFAFRPLGPAGDGSDPEQSLVFTGLLGMIDPPRPEAAVALRKAQAAGIKTVMITGDYPDTARAIGKQIGLFQADHRMLTGAELDRLGEEGLAREVDTVDAYARVSPQHKVMIVDALRARGHVVAMTGDGVNDAPALKRADIGVAMGIAGTDVSKETADMVLTDDNYASIVSAVEEGRTIYSNIRKFVYYLVSCNVGEILVIFVAMLVGLPIPLRPIQLLWLNLVTDGAPALALGMEKADPDVMQRPPRPPNEPVLNRESVIRVAVQAVVMTAAVLGAFLYGLSRFPGNLAGAQTVAFGTLIASELLRAFTARSERRTVFELNFFSNPWLVLANASSLLLLLAVIYVPFLDPIFSTTFLGWQDWLIMLPFICADSVASEITKLIIRRLSKTPAVPVA